MTTEFRDPSTPAGELPSGSEVTPIPHQPASPAPQLNVVPAREASEVAVADKKPDKKPEDEKKPEKDDEKKPDKKPAPKSEPGSFAKFWLTWE